MASAAVREHSIGDATATAVLFDVTMCRITEIAPDGVTNHPQTRLLVVQSATEGWVGLVSETGLQLPLVGQPSLVASPNKYMIASSPGTTVGVDLSDVSSASDQAAFLELLAANTTLKRKRVLGATVDQQLQTHPVSGMAGTSAIPAPIAASTESAASTPDGTIEAVGAANSSSSAVQWLQVPDLAMVASSALSAAWAVGEVAAAAPQYAAAGAEMAASGYEIVQSSVKAASDGMYQFASDVSHERIARYGKAAGSSKQSTKLLTDGTTCVPKTEAATSSVMLTSEIDRPSYPSGGDSNPATTGAGDWQLAAETLTAAGQIAAAGLTVGARYTGSGLKAASHAVMASWQPPSAATAVAVSEETMESIRRARAVSSTVALLSGGAARAMGEMAKAMGQATAQLLKQNADRSETAKKSRSPTAADDDDDGDEEATTVSARDVAAMGLAGVGALADIWAGLESAATIVASELADVTEMAVDKKYGAEAAEATRRALAVGGDAGRVLIDVRKMAVTTFVVQAGKHAAADSALPAADSQPIASPAASALTIGDGDAACERARLEALHSVD